VLEGLSLATEAGAGEAQFRPNPLAGCTTTQFLSKFF